MLVLFATVGDDAPRGGARSHDRLPRHRADVDRGVRAGRPQPAQRPVGRGGTAIFPARRVLDRVSAVRHRAHLRRDRAPRTCTTIGDRIHATPWPGTPAGLGRASRCSLVGFAFKVAAVPFHMWAPDVYEGAPTPITAFMAAAVKAAAFAAFLRVWLESFADVVYQWHDALWFAGGPDDGRRQRRRARAAEHQAHAGVFEHRAGRLRAGRRSSPASALGASAFLFYLAAYTLATMGAFAVIVALGDRRRDASRHRRLRGTVDDAPLARGRDERLYAVAAGLPHLRRPRLPRQVVHAAGGARGELFRRCRCRSSSSR